MEFEKVIVHVLDCEHNNCITSVSCMENMSVETEKMLLSKAEKVFQNAGRKKAIFKEESTMKKRLAELKEEKLSFEECSEQIANIIFEKKMQYALYQSSDLVIAILKKEGRRYFLVLDNSYMEGITHNLQANENGSVNEIVPCFGLLSANLVKQDRAFLVELSDFSIHCVENKVEIEGEKVNFMADIILQSNANPSYKETFKCLSKVSEAVSEKYDLDEVEIVPKMKSMLVDSASMQQSLSVDDVAQVLFSSPLAQADFKEEIKKQGIPEKIEMEYVKPAKAEKVQKIKTDKGIEIIIPVDYMNSKEYVEFCNHPDGTISIQLKNITYITSK